MPGYDDLYVLRDLITRGNGADGDWSLQRWKEQKEVR